MSRTLTPPSTDPWHPLSACRPATWWAPWIRRPAAGTTCPVRLATWLGVQFAPDHVTPEWSDGALWRCAPAGERRSNMRIRTAPGEAHSVNTVAFRFAVGAQALQRKM